MAADAALRRTEAREARQAGARARLSWSMLDAMSSSCVVLASDTPPVREFVEDGTNGLLCDFFDADRFAARALEM